MTGSRYVYFLSCVALTLAACGCSASSPAPGARAANAPASVPASAPVAHAGAKARGFTTPAPGDTRTLAFAKAIGVDCNADSGSFSCVGGRIEVGDYADVTFSLSCGPDGQFAVVAKPTEMRDLIAPLDTRTIAKLGVGDALCISASGDVSGKPFYYFASRRLRATTDTCNDAHSCAHSLGACTISQDGLLPKDCESGWIWAEDLRRL